MNCDVLIVGGGAVGLTTAAGLCAAGFSVVVVDAANASPRAPSGAFDLRVSALTRAAENVLTRLGAWPRMDPMRLAPFEQMRVWDSAVSGELQFGAEDIGEPYLGTLAENANVVAALTAVLREDYAERCHWRLPGLLEALHCDASGAVARVSGDHIRAGLVVGADGSNSKVRELLGLQTRVRDYQQSAVVATLRTQLAHQSTAWQRFLANGPIAMLPLPGEFTSIVWSTTPDEAAELISMPTLAFNQRVAEALDHRFGEVVWSGERGRFALRRVEATAYVAERAVLVGDSAHTIHPLAGQGLNLGLMDAAALCEVLEHARRRDREFATRSVLRRYERWRKTQNVLTQNAMDALRWFFADRPLPIRIVREIGMHGVNALTPLKRELSRTASGIIGDLPALARPLRT